MAELPEDDYVILGGDFNARTNKIPDYANENDKDTTFLTLPENYKLDEFTKSRNNQDIHTNTYGEKLIDFAISTKMRILNGRTLGDFLGKFTYIGYNGVSVVDYVLASENFLMKNYIHSFTVNDLTELSDHRPLELNLKFTHNITSIKQNTDHLIPKK